MRKKSLEHINKVHGMLKDKTYVTATELADNCGLAVGSIYRVIKEMRRKGVGVYPTKKGYVLAELAQKKDDLLFTRRTLGHYASLRLSVKAAAPSIEHRWGNEMRDVLAPIHLNGRSESMLRKGMLLCDKRLESIDIREGHPLKL